VGQLNTSVVGAKVFPMSLKENLIVVLHQTRSPDNLGAVARLMANFALPTLILSEPVTYAFRAAQKMGVKGQRVLENLSIAASLPEAIGDAVYACGTTSRTEVEGRPYLSPEQAVVRLYEQAARGKVALVFGGEKRGLSDQDLSVCQEYVVIPTSDEQPSMNLAQSAAVMLYLCSQAFSQGASAPPSRVDPGAQLRTVQVLEERMREALLASGFLNPQAPDYVLREMERSLLRANLSQREAEMWLAAFKQLARVAKR
jgi:tRNA/rRNA methyltransferase